MAPEIGKQIEALKQNGKLNIMAGKIADARAEANGLAVTYRPRGAAKTHTIQAALLLNCTGPDQNIAATRHTLLANLHKRGLIIAHPLGTGIALAKKAAPAIFPIGPLLVGERLESIAVPELREQAREAATAVLLHLNDSSCSGLTRASI